MHFFKQLHNDKDSLNNKKLKICLKNKNVKILPNKNNPECKTCRIGRYKPVGLSFFTFIFLTKIRAHAFSQAITSVASCNSQAKMLDHRPPISRNIYTPLFVNKISIYQILFKLNMDVWGNNNS